jgi:uncharacterized protein (DUF1330 family)
MPAYLISICKRVSNRQALEDYWANARPTFEGTNATPLVAYTQFEVLEGEGPVEGIVLFEFPSVDVARRWYHSEEYQEVKRKRDGAAEYHLILVDGGWVSGDDRMPKTRMNTGTTAAGADAIG